jgi:hypothetical protein
VQGEFCVSCYLVYARSTICEYKGQSSWNSNSNALEPINHNNDYPITCVITQYYSSTAISLCFHSIMEKLSVCLKNVIISIFLHFLNCVSLKLCKFKLRMSGNVCKGWALNPPEIFKEWNIYTFMPLCLHQHTYNEVKMVTYFSTFWHQQTITYI